MPTTAPIADPGHALMKKDQLASRSFRRRAVRLADNSARGSVLAPARRPEGCAWDPGVESRRSDRSHLHDVKQRRRRSAFQPAGAQTCEIRTSRRAPLAEPHWQSPIAGAPDWWSQTGSNRRPPACKAGALPTELWPQQRITRGRGLRTTDDIRRPACRPSFACHRRAVFCRLSWWAWDDSNVRPHPYQGCALTT